MLVLDFALLWVTLSYLIMGVVATGHAARVWWAYAIVVAVLALADVIADYKRQEKRHARPPR